MFDIVDISNFLGVSDKTVYRYLRKYDSQLRKYFREKNGKKALTRKGLEVLAEISGNEIQYTKDYQDDILIDFLRKQILSLEEDKKNLQAQNKALQAQISNLTKLLDQEQQLRLHSIKQLEEPTEEIQEDITDRVTEKSFFQKMIDKIGR